MSQKVNKNALPTRQDIFRKWSTNPLWDGRVYKTWHVHLSVQHQSPLLSVQVKLGTSSSAVSGNKLVMHMPQVLSATIFVHSSSITRIDEITSCDT